MGLKKKTKISRVQSISLTWFYETHSPNHSSLISKAACCVKNCLPLQQNSFLKTHWSVTIPHCYLAAVPVWPHSHQHGKANQALSILIFECQSNACPPTQMQVAALIMLERKEWIWSHCPEWNQTLIEKLAENKFSSLNYESKIHPGIITQEKQMQKKSSLALHLWWSSKKNFRASKANDLCSGMIV